MKNITDLPISDISQPVTLDVRQYGGKASNLAALVALDIHVPPAIVIGKDVFGLFLAENGIEVSALEKIHNMGMLFLESALQEAQEWQKRIVDAINNGPFSEKILDNLWQRIDTSNTKKYAVRSSCVNEDASSASFAGQFATILNVSGKEKLLKAIRSCWVSQYSTHAISYAISRRGMPVLIPSMAVLVQEMIEPDFAGICFTEGPTPKTKKYMIIESVPGIGDVLVSGNVTPCYYEIEQDGTIHRVLSSPSSKLKPPERMINRLTKECQKISSHFQYPQDIEWAIRDGNLYILQTRPITVIGGNRKNSVLINNATQITSKILSGDSPLLILRDELHEWMISKLDPMAYRGATFILLSQKAHGGWNLENNPEWDVVATAMIIMLLLGGGIPASLTWTIPNTNHSQIMFGIPLAIEWIMKHKNAKNYWGTDYWDTCQVIRSLIMCGYQKNEPWFENIIKNVSNEIMGEYNLLSEQEWFGPGVFAVALQLFLEIDSAYEADKYASLLLKIQAPDGEYLGPHHLKDRPQVPSVWHTAQAITALEAYYKKSKKKSKQIAISIDKACTWLLSKQQEDGSWGVSDESYSRYNVFFTSYAMIALASMGSAYEKNIDSAYKWLKRMQHASGSFGDIASSLMAMSAIQQMIGPVFSMSLPIPIFLRIQATLGKYSTNN